MSGPLKLLGDPDATVCEGDVCALPASPPPDPQDAGEEPQPPAA